MVRIHNQWNKSFKKSVKTNLSVFEKVHLIIWQLSMLRNNMKYYYYITQTIVGWCIVILRFFFTIIITSPRLLSSDILLFYVSFTLLLLLCLPFERREFTIFLIHPIYSWLWSIKLLCFCRLSIFKKKINHSGKDMDFVFSILVVVFNFS
jgi:hypothetical protein